MARDVQTLNIDENMKGSPLLEAEKRQYVKDAKEANFYSQVSTYLQYGGLALLAVCAGAFFADTGTVKEAATALAKDGAGQFASNFSNVIKTISFGLIDKPFGWGASLGWAFGASALVTGASILFSRIATGKAELNNIMYSDIDAQQKSRRYVQAFAEEKVTGKETASILQCVDHAKANSTGLSPQEMLLPSPDGNREVSLRTDNKNWVEIAGKAQGQTAGNGKWKEYVTYRESHQELNPFDTSRI